MSDLVFESSGDTHLEQARVSPQSASCWYCEKRQQHPRRVNEHLDTEQFRINVELFVGITVSVIRYRLPVLYS